MKITRRSDNGKSGHLLISVPASRVAEVEAALTFLEEKRQQRGSQVITDLIVRAALRNGWRPPRTAPTDVDRSGQLALPTGRLQMPETDQLALLLVPQVQPQRFQAAPKRDRRHILELRVLFHTLLQRIVRDARAQVVDVVEPNVASEPLQHLRQLEVRAAADRSGRVIPLLVALPVGALELVLNIEHPDPAQAAHKRHRQLDQQERLDPDRQRRDNQQCHDEQVAEVDTDPLALL